MAKHTKSNLCKQLGIKANYLNVNIERGKVIVDKNGKINDTIPQNAEFINKRLLSNEQKKEDIPEVKENHTKETLTKYELETRKKELEVEHLDVQVNIKRITEAKLRGEMLPSVLVRDMIAQLAKNLVSEFENVMDKALTLIAQKTKLDNVGVSEFRGMIKIEINKAQKQAIEKAKKSTDQIVKEMKE